MDDGRPTGRAPGAPTPRWLTADDPLGRPPDRQVLVVGDGPAGLALAAFLASAGLDPVLVGGDSPQPATGLLLPSTLGLLADVAAADAVASAAEPVRAVSVVRADDRATPTTRAVDPDAGAPLVVRSDHLCNALREGIPRGAVERDRGVEAVREREGTAVVEFRDGVRERFDVVVAADGAAVGRQSRAPDAAPAIATCEFPTDGDGLPAGHLRDVRHRNALVQRLPSPGDGGRLRATTTAPVPEPWLAGGDWTGVPGLATDTPRAAEWRAVPQFRDGDAIAPERWGSGRRPRCGAAALPVAAATGLRTALAIEDARALAAVLVDGPPSVGDAVDAYAARRSRRLSAVVDGAEPEGNAGYPDPSVLRTVQRLRTAALDAVSTEPGPNDP